MTRTKWKGPYVETKLLINSQKLLSKSKKILKTISRNSEIIPNFIGMTFNIYNGKKFINLTVTEKMIGHKFGEFSPTRKKFYFKKKIKT
jgi:small subunit ribosomal protein S19